MLAGCVLCNLAGDRSSSQALYNHSTVQRWAESGSKGFESESKSLHFARIRIRIRIHSSFQWIRILIRILLQRIRIRIRESTVNMHDLHDLKSQYRVPSYVLHIQTLIYLNVLALLTL